ncbi:MAG TPA: branched-chain amino acid ABC transporter permease [Caldimonas sp.]|jgi:branched-chain amino acid transport system permease protein|nr:branched-chain amino acid ABC transporter permease [Caldimonas sp.]HEX2540568.1 branched-chain amino acid ABC transporter permease [Caldimonas sp.]
MKLALVILAVLALAVFPQIAPDYYITLVLPALAYGIALLGFNLLFGSTGLLSFGHALFVAIGAYGAAVLSSKLGVKSFEAVLLIAGAAAVAIALPVGLLSVRYVRIFFGILTLAFGMLFHSFLFKFYDITGGDTGIRVLRPALLGMDFKELDKTAFLIGPFYYYCLALLVVLGVVMWRLVHSPFGLHLVAIRENPRKAEYLGVRVRLFRLIAFLISAFYCAIGGVILAVNTGQADPELAYWTHSGELVFMTVLGGFASFFGPLVGAFTFIFLKSELMGVTQYWRFVLGLTLLLIVILFPRGLMGLANDLWARARRA